MLFTMQEAPWTQLGLVCSVCTWVSGVLMLSWILLLVSLYMLKISCSYFTESRKVNWVIDPNIFWEQKVEQGEIINPWQKMLDNETLTFTKMGLGIESSCISQRCFDWQSLLFIHTRILSVMVRWSRIVSARWKFYSR